jgi:cell division septum initiation protein DivIVA
MTDKEFRKLKRSDLISIIYEYQKRQDELLAEIDSIKTELDDKRIKISNAGSIADAVVGLDFLFETAQKTADDYLAQIKLRVEEAEKRAEEIIAEAEKKAAEIIEKASSEAEKEQT